LRFDLTFDTIDHCFNPIIMKPPRLRENLESDEYQHLSVGDDVVEIAGMKIRLLETINWNKGKNGAVKMGFRLKLGVNGEPTEVIYVVNKSTLNIKGKEFYFRLTPNETQLWDRVIRIDNIELKPVETFESMFPSLKTRLMQWLGRFKVGVLLNSKKI
jgi:hypothetical protein